MPLSFGFEPDGRLPAASDEPVTCTELEPEPAPSVGVAATADPVKMHAALTMIANLEWGSDRDDAITALLRLVQTVAKAAIA